MKEIFAIVMLISLVSNANADAQRVAIDAFPDGTKYITDKFVVVTEDNLPPLIVNVNRHDETFTGVESIDRLCGELGIERVESFYKGVLRKPNLKKTLDRIYIFTLSDVSVFSTTIKAFNDIAEIKSAEFMTIPEFHYEPNDPFLFQQWYLPHTQTLEAWDIVRGDTTRHSIIAIIDTGVDWDHDDLQPNIWVNDLEDLNGNGVFDSGDNNYIDDDDNGFIDDVIGWDFGDNDNDPSEDALLHGSAVASVASEATDNDILGAGIGFSSRLMPVKAANSDGSFPIDVWNGVIYAADNGAQIINCSWGTTFYNQFEQDIINAVWAEDVLVIASAGANGDTPAYPAAYDNVIAVTATDQDDRKPYFAGYGEWVDISAPGIDILVISGNDYEFHNGTSYSTAMVSGLAALVRAWYPDYSNYETENLIKDSAEPIDHLNPGYQGMLGAGRINAYNCFETTGNDNYQYKLPGMTYLRTYPNPFNPSATIDYGLVESILITLSIYNLLGQRITTVFEGVQNAGEHTITWDASAFPSGVYFARLEAEGRTENVKMIMLK
ncbi:MAG: S8/S53 family peptidase [candidate division Zixibacteria bacterium]